MLPFTVAFYGFTHLLYAVDFGYTLRWLRLPVTFVYTPRGWLHGLRLDYGCPTTLRCRICRWLPFARCLYLPRFTLDSFVRCVTVVTLPRCHTTPPRSRYVLPLPLPRVVRLRSPPPPLLRLFCGLRCHHHHHVRFGCVFAVTTVYTRVYVTLDAVGSLLPSHHTTTTLRFCGCGYLDLRCYRLRLGLLYGLHWLRCVGWLVAFTWLRYVYGFYIAGLRGCVYVFTFTLPIASYVGFAVDSTLPLRWLLPIAVTVAVVTFTLRCWLDLRFAHYRLILPPAVHITFYHFTVYVHCTRYVYHHVHILRILPFTFCHRTLPRSFTFTLVGWFQLRIYGSHGCSLHFTVRLRLHCIATRSLRLPPPHVYVLHFAGYS